VQHGFPLRIARPWDSRFRRSLSGHSSSGRSYQGRSSSRDSSCDRDCRHCRYARKDPHCLRHENRRVPSARKSWRQTHRFRRSPLLPAAVQEQTLFPDCWSRHRGHRLEPWQKAVTCVAGAFSRSENSSRPVMAKCGRDSPCRRAAFPGNRRLGRRRYPRETSILLWRAIRRYAVHIRSAACSTARDWKTVRPPAARPVRAVIVMPGAGVVVAGGAFAPRFEKSCCHTGCVCRPAAPFTDCRRVDVTAMIERQRCDFLLGRAVQHESSPAGECDR